MPRTDDITIRTLDPWDFEYLLCDRCGYLHEPGDDEACVPVPADEQLAADQDEYEL